MKNLAKHLAAEGRNGDTELLHVSKGELATLHGLGSLVGKPMTTNPTTGLPEAFNWQALIPAIVGIGGSVLSGGALSPLMAGMISGVATTAVTGDYKKGIMSGLTGGMLGGLGQGIVGMGTSAAAAAAPAAAPAAEMAASAAPAMVESGAAGAGLGAGMTGAMDTGIGGAEALGSGATGAMDMGIGGAGLASSGAGAGMAAGETGAMDMGIGGVGAAAQQAPQFSGSTLANNVMNPDAWSANFGGNNLYTRTIPGALAAASVAQNATQPTGPAIKPISAKDQRAKDFAAPEKTMSRDLTMPSDPYYPLKGGEPLYFSAPKYNFAEGGRVLPDRGLYMDTPMQENMYRDQSKPGMPDLGTWERIPAPKVDKNGKKIDSDYYKNSKTKEMATGGLAGMGLGGLSQGDSSADKVVKKLRSRYRSKQQAVDDMRVNGSYIQQLGIQDPNDPLLQTAFGYTANQGKKSTPTDTMVSAYGMAAGGRPGDGMSDSIPALINGQKPARLSQDEYVVPADAVSHLGNGSSAGGANQLDSMVARIRAARTGTARQAPKINPNRFLPK